MEGDTLADAASRLAGLEQALQAAPDAAARVAALEQLVAAFPLLYGYWIKLVAETRSDERAAAWRRALAQCPTLELWTAYLQAPEGAGAEPAQGAVAALGQHFHAEPLWDAYIARGAPPDDRLRELLRTPLYAYSKYFQLVYERQLETPDTLARLSEETAAGVTARWAFESQLTRLYFHAVPLDAAELRVWDAYLDFEESEGDAARIGTLYERCLTATALYAGFWLRWIRWLGLGDDTAATDRAFARAFHYHPRNAELALLYVRTLEARGSLDASRAKLADLDDVRELVAFDLRHGGAAPDRGESQAYAIELARQTGRLDLLSEESKQSSVMFDIPGLPAPSLLPLWRQGLCPDVRAFAARLRAEGALAEFFEVDSTLGYGV